MSLKIPEDHMAEKIEALKTNPQKNKLTRLSKRKHW